MMKPSILIFLIYWSLIPQILAHQSSNSYLTLDVKMNSIDAKWDIDLKDLEFKVGVDSDFDNQITWAELKNRETPIVAYAFSQLNMQQQNANCQQHDIRLMYDQYQDTSYAVLKFKISCPDEIDVITLSYNLFFDIDNNHRGFVRLLNNNANNLAVFSPENNLQTLKIKSAFSAVFSSFSKEGMWHIWNGFDHLLFLICLLLPSVLVYKDARWIVKNNAMTIVWDIMKIVTAFTVAHSITLTLSVLKIVTLPVHLVEAMIAISVLIVALNNLYPRFNEKRWMLAFSFGLIHGFGLANVLNEFELSSTNLGMTLISFNIGVEIGQLAIVCMLFPVIYLMRQWRIYSNGFLQTGSLLTMVLAMIWFSERVFDISIINI